MNPRIGDAGAGVRVARADNAGPLTLDGTRTYLVGPPGPGAAAHPPPAILIDPGPAAETQLALLRELVAGDAIAAVCLTHAHADHAGAAEQAARAFGAPVTASPGTLERLGIEGVPLHDRDSVRDALEREGVPAPMGSGHILIAVATPGHTSDHLCYFRPVDRWLFTGDLVLGSGTTVILHPDGDVGAYLASLARLLALRPARILPGHGDPVERPAARLEEHRAHRLERERQIADAVRSGARTVPEIRGRVYGTLPPALAGAAAASIRAHLAHLRRREPEAVDLAAVDDPEDGAAAETNAEDHGAGDSGE